MLGQGQLQVDGLRAAGALAVEAGEEPADQPPLQHCGLEGGRAHEVIDLLVDFAEAESAVTDALLPDRDDEDDRVQLWREALDHLSAAFCASADRDIRTLQAELATCRTARDRLVDVSDRWPATVRARAAEGFACYALYPLATGTVPARTVNTP